MEFDNGRGPVELLQTSWKLWGVPVDTTQILEQ